MVEIRNIKQETHELFDPNDYSLGFVNDNQFRDIQIQIGSQRLEGYYLLFNGNKVPIKPNGKIERWPRGLFELNTTQLDIILDLAAKTIQEDQTIENLINIYESTYIVK